MYSLAYFYLSRELIILLTKDIDMRVPAANNLFRCIIQIAYCIDTARFHWVNLNLI